jgi:hypothetical protein
VIGAAMFSIGCVEGAVRAKKENNMQKPFSEVLRTNQLPNADNFKLGTVFELPDLSLHEVVDDESRINDHAFELAVRYEDENDNLFVMTRG